ncbi:MAG TPA: PspA/IM30 family protein [Chthonomonas sp.]|uniref:PspA/IM30 family protein n=1 Tax=Chthonomonas sp. TaxID=2282153 RepID=UPI002B4AE155|nr:PspA/IM30 family protein [Chthonomonas sp.]HLI47721.1 PspA/IM30 family protein [Chthonomonas sp.]
MASNPFKRFWRYLMALLSGKLDQWEDPEVIINEAVREMRENQIKNRELAVQAITQKNNLQAEVEKEERLVADLEKKAAIALQGGNRELALQFLREKLQHEQTLEQMRASLAQAIEAAEKVKTAIKLEEDRIRQKTAQALALKAKMKQAQIEIKINKALDQFQFSNNEQQWGAVEERIRSMQSEAAARAEVANTSIDARVRELEASQMDAQAEQELAQLEAKLSLGTGTTNNYVSANQQQVQTVGTGGSGANGSAAPESELDRQLAELEAKLNNQNKQ